MGGACICKKNFNSDLEKEKNTVFILPRMNSKTSNHISLEQKFALDESKQLKDKSKKSIFVVPKRAKSNTPVKKLRKSISKSNEYEIINRNSRSQLAVPVKRYALSPNSAKSIDSRISTSKTGERRKKFKIMLYKLKKFQEKNLENGVLIERDFAVELFIQINKLRNNCLSYSKKIDYYSKFIEEINGDKFLVLEIGEYTSNSSLLEGLSAFKEAIIFLEKFYKDNSSLNRLVHKNELKIPFPKDLTLVDNIDYIKYKAEEIKKKLKGQYDVTGFTYDITYKDAEITTLMQIVDDNHGNKNRRKNLLNKEIKYIGINYKELNDGKYAVYILLAK